MRDSENVCQIGRLRPDLLGLIFFSGSARCVSLAQAADLPSFESIERVGVFVNENLVNIAETVRHLDLDFVQLHGGESPEFCAQVRDSLPELKIIKAFGIDENFDFEKVNDYSNTVDFFLFDTKTRTHGGSGRPFDWQILQRAQKNIKKPFFLGGGIGLENVCEAISACQNLPLYAVDINSRAEVSPGLKSEKIVREIIDLIDKNVFPL